MPWTRPTSRTARVTDIVHRAIDQAFEQQVTLLFGIMCAGGPGDDEALKRFVVGFERAMRMRKAALERFVDGSKAA